MSQIRENYLRLLDRIHNASARSGRQPESIRLVAATKTVEPQLIEEAVECGVRDIGENRVQEAIKKRAALSHLPMTWHLIGHLQTNKARKAAEHFDWIQSLDRLDLALRLEQIAAKPIPVLIEVKLLDEPNKSGLAESELPEMVGHLRSFKQIELRGLMAIPPFFDDAEQTRPFFQRLRRLAADFHLPEVSMGMSHDFAAAIEEGATMIRIGTALFGPRR